MTANSISPGKAGTRKGAYDAAKLQSELALLRDENEQLKQRLASIERSQGEVYTVRQQLHEFEYYKKRCADLELENATLVEAKQRLEDQLSSSQKREEQTLGDLVQVQITLDQRNAELIAEKQRIVELLSENSGLQREKAISFQRQLATSRNEDQQMTNAQRGKTLSGKQQPKSGELQKAQQDDRDALETEVQSAKARIRQLETECEKLRIEVATKQGEKEKAEKWKSVEMQKEKMELRREIHKLKGDVDQLNNQLVASKDTVNNAVTERDATLEELRVLRDSHETHTAELETKIRELADCVLVLRRKVGTRAANAQQVRELEAQELELMYRSVQDLTTQLSRLKQNQKILRLSCDRLKEQVNKILLIENENERLKKENVNLHRMVSSQNTSSEESDTLKKRNYALEIENHKLRRIVESLRAMLVQIDPNNWSRYNYMSTT